MEALSLLEARRMAVRSQLLDAPQPTDLLEVIRHLFGLQMDPTASIARAERLVLWSRLGAYDVKDLERAIYQDRDLFEYWAWILPMSDFPIHAAKMRRYATATTPMSRARRQAWMKANAGFRRYVLAELRTRGPLASRALEDRAEQRWHTDGWNEGRSLSRMLEVLWSSGEVAIAGREGNERLWDIASRHYPPVTKRPSEQTVARTIIERQLKARSPAMRTQFGYQFDDRPPGHARAMRDLQREGVVVPVAIEGMAGTWYAHRDALARTGRFEPRTTFLAPFDRLIHNRVRTEALWDFSYRIEIYVPPAKRQYGYYVLPILHGERLVGRIDPVFDRANGVLEIKGLWSEKGAPAEAGPGIAAAITDLARWVGANDIRFTKPPAPVWRAELKEISASARGRTRAAGPMRKARRAARPPRRGSRSADASR
jgi:uncharacterized protein